MGRPLDNKTYEKEAGPFIENNLVPIYAHSCFLCKRIMNERSFLMKCFPDMFYAWDVDGEEWIRYHCLARCGYGLRGMDACMALDGVRMRMSCFLSLSHASRLRGIAFGFVPRWLSL